MNGKVREETTTTMRRPRTVGTGEVMIGSEETVAVGEFLPLPSPSIEFRRDPTDPNSSSLRRQLAAEDGTRKRHKSLGHLRAGGNRPMWSRSEDP